jgi:hypothetical protein
MAGSMQHQFLQLRGRICQRSQALKRTQRTHQERPDTTSAAAALGQRASLLDPNADTSRGQMGTGSALATRSAGLHGATPSNGRSGRLCQSRVESVHATQPLATANVARSEPGGGLALAATQPQEFQATPYPRTSRVWITLWCKSWRAAECRLVRCDAPLPIPPLPPPFQPPQRLQMSTNRASSGMSWSHSLQAELEHEVVPHQLVPHPASMFAVATRSHRSAATAPPMGHYAQQQQYSGNGNGSSGEWDEKLKVWLTRAATITQAAVERARSAEHLARAETMAAKATAQAAEHHGQCGSGHGSRGEPGCGGATRQAQEAQQGTHSRCRNELPTKPTASIGHR